MRAVVVALATLAGVLATGAAPSGAAGSSSSAATVEPSTTSFRGPFERISVSTADDQADASAGNPVLSADGSVVVFTSAATTLVPGDTNGAIDLFLRDRAARTTERIDVASDGIQADAGPGPYYDEPASVSDDGNLVAFSSRATNLVAGDSNAKSDVFLRDRAAGTTTRLSLSSTGAQAAGTSYGPVISGDGRFVVFSSYAHLTPDGADDLQLDVYRKDLATGALELVSTAEPDGPAGGARTSSDGRWIAFGQGDRILRLDTLDGSLVDVAVGLGGGSPDVGGAIGGISDDGSRVVFASDATNLVADDPEGRDAFFVDLAAATIDRLTEAVPLNGEAWNTALSRDGSAVVVEQMNRPLRIHRIDAGQVVEIEDEWSSLEPSISANGDLVAFRSGDTNHVPGDTNDEWDVFVADLANPLDLEGPEVTCGAADGGWHAANVTVPCTASDPSGLADPGAASFSLSTELPAGFADGDLSTAARTVCDTLGNCTHRFSPGHRIDRAAPTATIEPGSSGLFVVGAQVSLDHGCADVGSGVASCTARLDGALLEPGSRLPLDEIGTRTLAVEVEDGVGNSGGTEAEVQVTDEVLSGSMRRSSGNQVVAGASVRLWPLGAVDPVATATTDSGGRYRFARADVDPGLYQVHVSSPGYEPRWLGGPDRASSQVLLLGTRPQVSDGLLVSSAPVDTTAPAITCPAPPPLGSFSATEVVVTCNATDAGSGLADPSSASFTLSTTVGAGNELYPAVTPSRQVCDQAGNCATAGPFGPYAVDRKAPLVDIGGPSATTVYTPGADLRALYSCHDLSLVSCVSNYASGQPVPNTPGPHSFTVTATDYAGRVTTVTHTYTVASTTLRGVVDAASPGGVLVELWLSTSPPSDPPLTTATTSANGAWSIPNLKPNQPYRARYSKTGYDTLWQGGTTSAESSQLMSGPTGGLSPIYGVKLHPNLAPSLACSPPSGASWSGAQIGVVCQAFDPSGLASPELASFVLLTSVPSGAESTQAFTNTRSVCDNTGNCATAGPFGPYKVDRKAPTASCSTVPTTWVKTEVTVGCSVADAGSGAVPFIPSTITTNVGAGNWNANASTNSRSACDNVGNCTTVQRTGLKVDRAAPDASCGAVPTTWSAGPVTLSCTPSDPGVGMANSGVPVPLVASIALGTETASAVGSTASLCDTLGNCAPKTLTGFKLDRKGPSITCQAPDGLWHNANVSLPCTQTDGGSGLTATVTIIFGFSVPNPMNFSVTTGVGASSESASATATHAGFSKCDNVGNCSTASVPGNKIDRKAPTASCPAKDTDWHGANVTVTCTPADGGSGTDAAPFPSTTTAAAGTESSSVPMSSTSVCDRVGNCGPLAGPTGWKIDRKAPSVTLTTPAAGSSFSRGAVVKAAYTCADGGSGAAGCSGTLPVDSLLPTATVGPRSFSVTAVDAVGNTATSDAAWSVVAPISGVVTDAATGQPVGGVTVQVIPVGGSATKANTATTAADGSYRLEAAKPGSYQVQFLQPGNYLGRWFGDVTSRTTATVVTLDGTHPVQAGTSLIRPATLRGTVVSEATGAPVPGVKVELYPLLTGSVPTGTAVTGADGRWVVTGLAAANYRVRYLAPVNFSSEWHSDRTTRPSAIPAPVAAGADVDLGTDDLANTSLLSGTLRDAVTGAPVAGASVRFYRPGTSVTGGAETRTASDGTWSVAVPVGTRHLAFAKAGYKTGWWRGSLVRSKTTAVVVALDQPRTLDDTLTPS